MNKFNIKIKVLFIGLILSVSFILFPSITFSASVYFSTDYPSISVGDTIIVNLMVDPKDKKPNVIEGNILVENGLENIDILEFSEANSILNYWLQSPSLDGNSNISFVGGAPGGFTNQGLLFKIVFTAIKGGKVTFSPNGFKIYNNDEKSTLIDVLASGLTIDIGPKTSDLPKNQWLETISTDNQPPQQLSAIIGQDSSIFEGKKFITISATDSQSGVDYYEVQEGNWPTVRSGTTYVLLDQNESSNIIVTAYDKSGNYSKIILKPFKPKVGYIAWIIILVLLFIMFYLFFRILKKNRNKN